MNYFISSYKDDSPMLVLLLPNILRLDPDASICLAVDPSSPINKDDIPEHCRAAVHIYETHYPRQGNLNGMKCIKGQLETMLCYLESPHAVPGSMIVKMDCDVVLQRLNWIDPTADYCGAERSETFAPCGCCYALSYRAITSILHDIERRHWQSSWHYPEDVATLQLCLHHRDADGAALKIKWSPWTEGICSGLQHGLPTDLDRKAAVIHCGEPLPGGRRADRAMVKMEMEFLTYFLEHPVPEGTEA